MSAQVIRLREEPDFSVRPSTMYRRKASSLSFERKGMLRRIERKFELHLRSRRDLKLRESDLIRGFEEATFKSEEGILYFFLSDDRKVTLLDFDLKADEGGGLPRAEIKYVTARRALEANRAIAARNALRRSFARQLTSRWRLIRRYLDGITALKGMPFSALAFSFTKSRQTLGRDVLFSHVVHGLTVYFCRSHQLIDMREERTSRPEHARRMLFSDIVGTLTARLDTNRADAAMPSWSILSRTSAPPHSQIAKRVLFAEMIGMLVSWLDADRADAPAPSWPMPSRLSGQHGQVAGHVLFSDTVGALIAGLDTGRTGARALSWPILSWINAPPQRQLTRYVLFGEIVGTLTACLDTNPTDIPAPSWSILSRIGVPPSSPFVRHVLLSEIVVMLTACLDIGRADTLALRRSILSIMGAEALPHDQVTRYVLFGQIVVTLAACLDLNATETAAPMRSTVPWTSDGAPHAQRAAFVDIVRQLSDFLHGS